MRKRNHLQLTPQQAAGIGSHWQNKKMVRTELWNSTFLASPLFKVFFAFTQVCVILFSKCILILFSLSQMKEKSYIFRKRVVRIKPRQSQGAVTAQKRPENSLLEETLHCDHAVRVGTVRSSTECSVLCFFYGSLSQKHLG